MNIKQLEKALQECSRFRDAAVEVRNVAWRKSGTVRIPTVIEYCKEAAACKRASMDLTRALADLRKPG